MDNETLVWEGDDGRSHRVVELSREELLKVIAHMGRRIADLEQLARQIRELAE